MWGLDKSNLATQNLNHHMVAASLNITSIAEQSWHVCPDVDTLTTLLVNFERKSCTFSLCLDLVGCTVGLRITVNKDQVRAFGPV